MIKTSLKKGLACGSIDPILPLIYCTHTTVSIHTYLTRLLMSLEKKRKDWSNWSASLILTRWTKVLHIIIIMIVQSPLNESEDELKSLSSDSDAENGDTSHKRDSGQRKKVYLLSN